MRIAFYAPLKSPTHTTPSGDRRVGRLLVDALQLAGHSVELASDLRSFEGTGDAHRQAAIREQGAEIARALTTRWMEGARHARPELWFTYHLYYKAPDWLGPAVSKALGIPYVVAEASYAAKRAGGAWNIGHVATHDAIQAAALLLCPTQDDVAGLQQVAPAHARVVRLPPFLDPEPYRIAAQKRDAQRSALALAHGLDLRRTWLVVVAMMRSGDKLESYRLLARTLGNLSDLQWQILVVGDGLARTEVQALLEGAAPGRACFLGECGADALSAIYAASDLYIWPSVNEAYGMSMLEAQAAGVPVVSCAVRGVPDVVRDGHTGLLAASGDVAGLAGLARGLILDVRRRAAMGQAAAQFVLDERSTRQAAIQLNSALESLQPPRAMQPGAGGDGMTLLVMLRHGQTQWSHERRIQGRTDIPLNDAGRAVLAGRRLPGEFASLHVASSPLRRCVETAQILGLQDVQLEPRLAEMSWGEWEGRQLSELRAEHGDAMAANEARGLDFTPPQGESPRQVLARVNSWLAELAAARKQTLAVCHRGVIRVVFAVAHGWDMLGKPPAKLDWGALHVFELDHAGKPAVLRLNVPLVVALGSEPGGKRLKRVLLYVQHLLGIGHLKRAATLADAMTRIGIEVTLVSGGPPVPGISVNAAHVVQLPPASAADLSFKALVDAEGQPVDKAWKQRRRELLLQAWRHAEPHAVVIELFPFGRRQMRFELLPLLEAARSAAHRPVIVSSVRDILGGGQKETSRQDKMLALFESYFDHLLVHGDPALIPFDRTFVHAARISGKLHYTGYVVDRPPPEGGPGGAPIGKGEVIVSVGGGAVGRPLLEAAVLARPLSVLAGHPWRLLAGSNVADSDLADLEAQAHVAGGAGVTVERNRRDFPELLENCRLSVSQGGYNTVMDILRAGAPAVLVPFAGGAETEQSQRARLLAERGRITMVEEADLSPKALADAIDTAARSGPASDGDLRLDGARESAALIARWTSELAW